MTLQDIKNILSRPLSWRGWEALPNVSFDKSEEQMRNGKKGFGKNWIDEILPLADFVRLHYPVDTPYFFEYVDGNQPYDMRVVDDQNNEIERIEVTKVIDGHSAKMSTKELIDRGNTMLPPNNENASDKLKKILLKKQSKDNYANCKLVIYIVEAEWCLYNLSEMIEIIRHDADNTFTGVFLVEKRPHGYPTQIVYAHKP
jgi:hypothetical protein